VNLGADTYGERREAGGVDGRLKPSQTDVACVPSICLCLGKPTGGVCTPRDSPKRLKASAILGPHMSGLLLSGWKSEVDATMPRIGPPSRYYLTARVEPHTVRSVDV
jgi:hypothetical protein